MQIQYCTIEDFLTQTDKKKVILFGTTYMAKAALSKIPQLEERVIAAVDNDSKKWGKTIPSGTHEISIFSPEYLEELDYESVVLLIVSQSFGVIRKQLDQNEKLKHLACYIYPWLLRYVKKQDYYQKRMVEPYERRIERKEDIFYQQIKEKVSAGQKPFILPGLNIIVSTYCNLSCKECSALIPDVKEKRHIPAKTVIADLERLFMVVDACATVDVIGGETFLYPELSEVVSYLIHQEKLQVIRLVTNGTILLSEETIKAIKHPKVKVILSDYGYIEKLAAVIHQLEENGISFEILTDMKWIKTGPAKFMDKSERDIAGEYMVCNNGLVCKTLVDGKIFGCGRSARLWSLGAYTSENDYREIGTETDTRNAVHHIMNLDKMDACNYCNIAREEEFVKPGEQRKKHQNQSAYTIVRRDEYENLLRGKNG